MLGAYDQMTKIDKPHHTEEFKREVVQYAADHPDETRSSIIRKFGVPQGTFYKWQKEFRESGEISGRGSGNHSSDEAKEIARLKKKLRDTEDALEVLKKAIGIVGR